MNNNLPLSNAPRLSYLDFLRGVAVLGLLLMNAPLMGVVDVGGYLPIPEKSVSDSIVRGVNALFFDGRFRSLFCILFGIGLYLQFNSYKNKGLDPNAGLKTRLKWLFLFGFLHAVFIWFGDILMLYAMSGAVLLSKMDDSAESLIKRGITWFLAGVVILAAITIFTIVAEPPAIRGSEEYLQGLAVTTSGYFSDWLSNLVVALAFVLSFPFVSVFYLCGPMMIGIGLFKAGYLKTGFTKPVLIGLITATIMVAGIDFVLATYYLDLWLKVANILGSISGFTMALVIWHCVVISKVHQSPSLLVAAIRRVGEMALTFYIMQSVIVTLLLQVIFPEWLDTFSLVNYMLLSFAVMAFQLVVAYLYKRSYNQGPLEFLWRKLVNRSLIKQAALAQR